jgi:hypothetical protein
MSQSELLTTHYSDFVLSVSVRSLRMKAKADLLLGIQWGDEGKGKAACRMPM